MLTHLSIQNLTLVDRLELEFSSGMSVITGETGAGKSIMLGALGLALGDRADSSLIAKDARKAEVNAGFDVSGQQTAMDWLSERELTDGNHCILRRVISTDGRSRAFVNGSSMTLSELKSLSEMLLDIHSQHEHQSLLKKETHGKLLDEFGGLREIAADLSELFTALRTLQERLNVTKTDAEEQSSRVQLLSYQAEELGELALQENEISQLEQEQKRLSSADSTLSNLIEVEQLCSKESDTSASSLTARALALLSSIEDDSINDVRDMLANAQIQLDEAMHDLEAVKEKFAADPARLRTVEDRLSRIYDIARKHKVKAEDIVELTAAIQEELDGIIHADERIAELEAEVQTAHQTFDTLAEKLSQSRIKTAQLLQSEITTELQNLGMDGAHFEASTKALDTPNKNGKDDIEFLIATIPGTDPGSLSKIASGGELSRISLAIQVVTAKTSDTPTLVFDEVDVGVGGATAEVVGNLLKRLGGDAQVICVTHLPQVAAQGHQHYVVSKSTQEYGAATTVVKLNEEEKVDEIARMLGGIEKTDQSIAHAESMLAGSKSA